MSIYTPKGLKIRIDVPTSFAYMARVFPNISPFKFLKTTESIDEIPTMFGIITAIICLVYHVSAFHLFIYVVSGIIFGLLLKEFAIVIFIPGLVKLGILFSYINIWLVPTIIVVVLSYLMSGWEAVLSFVGARLLAGFISLILEFILASYWNKKAGHPFAGSERSFFLTYYLYARKYDLPLNLNMDEEETEEENWINVYHDLESKWPEIVQRFG